VGRLDSRFVGMDRDAAGEEYEAGHMMYIHEGSLAKMKSDITAFYQETKSMSGRAVGNVPGGR